MADQRANPPTRPYANVLGVAIDATTMDAAVDCILEAVDARRKSYVCVTGVHGIMEARRNPAFAAVLARSALVVPDGMPMVWVGHLQGFHSMQRVFGPDLLLAVAERGQALGISHFFYGGAPGVACQLRDTLLQRFPPMRIAGTYTPPFRPLAPREAKYLHKQIDSINPDIIWVGLSIPKQEYFMASFLPDLSTTVMIGVGAAFDFHTGRIKDSPNWVKHAGLQWLHRLIQEPCRLWRRYFVNNPSFLYNIALQLPGVKHYPVLSFDHHSSFQL